MKNTISYPNARAQGVLVTGERMAPATPKLKRASRRVGPHHLQCAIRANVTKQAHLVYHVITSLSQTPGGDVGMQVEHLHTVASSCMSSM